MNMLYSRILQKGEGEPGESFNCIINFTRLSCVTAVRTGAECFWLFKMLTCICTSFQLSVPPTSRELIDLRLYMFRNNIEAEGDLDAHLPTLT